MNQETVELAILLPTYRFNDMARAALVSAAAIGSKRIAVYIGDNSENPSKHIFLRELASHSTNVFVFCHEKNLGAFGNIKFLISQHNAPFVCLAADDDLFTSGYFEAGLGLLLADQGCSAASGLFITRWFCDAMAAPGFSAPNEFRESSALDRIGSFVRRGGTNAPAYTVMRAKEMSHFADFASATPLTGSFYDQILTYHLLCFGSYRVDYNAPVYLYDETPWHAAPSKQLAINYVQAGLPEKFVCFLPIHWAVASVHYFESRYRPSHLCSEDAAEIAAFLFNHFRDQFAASYMAQREEIDAFISFDPSACTALANLLKMPFSSDLQIYHLFAGLLSAFEPALAERLLSFQLATLLPENQRPRPPVAPTSYAENRKPLSDRFKMVAQNLFKRGS